MPETIQYTVTTSPASLAAAGFSHCVKDATNDQIIALCTTEDDARTLRYQKAATDQDRKNDADRICRAEYFQDVRDTASSIQDELLARVKDGEYGETLREWLIEHIHETIDGSARVMYTGQAIECLLYSDNDGEYIEQFGTDGVVSDGSINWSTLAFSAFEADVQEQLEALGVDLNAPVPACEECDTEDQESDRKEVEGRLLCEDCRTEAAEQEDDEEEATEPTA